jgi:hypothetical protein
MSHLPYPLAAVSTKVWSFYFKTFSTVYICLPSYSKLVTGVLKVVHLFLLLYYIYSLMTLLMVFLLPSVFFWPYSFYSFYTGTFCCVTGMVLFGYRVVQYRGFYFYFPWVNFSVDHMLYLLCAMWEILGSGIWNHDFFSEYSFLLSVEQHIYMWTSFLLIKLVFYKVRALFVRHWWALEIEHFFYLSCGFSLY